MGINAHASKVVPKPFLDNWKWPGNEAIPGCVLYITLWTDKLGHWIHNFERYRAIHNSFCIDQACSLLESEGGSFHWKADPKPSWGSGGRSAGSGAAPQKKLTFYNFYVLKKLDFQYFGHNSGKQYSLHQLVFSPALFAPCDPSFTAIPRTLSSHAYVKTGEGRIRQRQTWTSGRLIRPFPHSPPHFLRLQVLTTNI